MSDTKIVFTWADSKIIVDSISTDDSIFVIGDSLVFEHGTLYLNGNVLNAGEFTATEPTYAADIINVQLIHNPSGLIISDTDIEFSIDDVVGEVVTAPQVALRVTKDDLDYTISHSGGDRLMLNEVKIVINDGVCIIYNPVSINDERFEVGDVLKITPLDVTLNGVIVTGNVAIDRNIEYAGHVNMQVTDTETGQFILDTELN